MFTTFGNQLACLGIGGTGSTTGLDGTTKAFWALNVGWIYKVIAESNSDLIYDTSKSKDFVDTVLPAILAKENAKYAKNPNRKIFMSKADWELCAADIAASRTTPLGDQVFAGLEPLPYRGVQIVWVPYWPDDYHLLCNPTNLVYGVYRGITLRSQPNVVADKLTYAITARVDFEIANIDAVVLGYNATP